MQNQRTTSSLLSARGALTVLLALAALLTAAAGAEAKGKFVLEGHGYGHGVGMSQYGAYGYAKHGVSYKKILTHYYSGTKIGKTKSKRIGVLLSTQPTGVGFKHAKRACGHDVKPSKTYRARLARGGSKIRLETSKGKKVASCGRRRAWRA